MHQSGCSSVRHAARPDVQRDRRASSRRRAGDRRRRRRSSDSSRSEPSLHTFSVRSHSGAKSGASFWKNDLPSMPSGKRVSTTGRSRRYGSSQGGDRAVVLDQVALRVAVRGPVDLVEVGERDARACVGSTGCVRSSSAASCGLARSPRRACSGMRALARRLVVAHRREHGMPQQPLVGPSRGSAPRTTSAGSTHVCFFDLRARPRAARLSHDRRLEPAS